MHALNPPRAAQIRRRLDRHFLEGVEIGVATPEPVWWWERSGGFGTPAILGWTYPIVNPDFLKGEEVSPYIAPYCPEIIDAQTTNMTESQLDDYLNVIEWVCDMHLTLWEEIEDPSDRFEEVLMRLREEHPASYDRFQEMLVFAQARQIFGEDR